VIQIEDLEIEIISDGQVWVDAGGPFGLVPRSLYASIIQPDEANRIPMDLNCLILRSDGKTILVDTGLGLKLPSEAIGQWGLERPEGSLLDGLEKLGISPGDIDIVLNTHLHGDHCGGNTMLSGSTIVAAFPNAEYWAQRLEWADACHPDVRTRATYHAENFNPLWREGRLRLLNGDTPVTTHVSCVVTPGHTRGHQSILLKAGNWHGLYVGDLASYSVHMARTAWLTAYDVLPLENIKTKQRWQQWALDHKACLFFEHDPEVKTARLIHKDGRLGIVAVDLRSQATGSPPT
jgi:glyoxylase-like metal-dependent hydrolase (beta-lactamase superfamily II)